jgi:hypothetical protein
MDRLHEVEQSLIRALEAILAELDFAIENGCESNRVAIQAHADQGFAALREMQLVDQ